MSTTNSHVPERTCIACRQKKAKREMTRLVNSFDGRVKIDYKKNEPGRGAYLCSASDCWEKVLIKDKKDRLAHALKATISFWNRKELSEYGKSLNPISGME